MTLLRRKSFPLLHDVRGEVRWRDPPHAPLPALRPPSCPPPSHPPCSDIQHSHVTRFLGATLTQPRETPAMYCLSICTEMATGSVAKVLATFGKLPTQVVQRFTRHLVHAVDHLHSRHILHRDIKCSNLLADLSTGSLCVNDLGSAKDVSGQVRSVP